jgi:hypothetical protein
MTDHTTERLSFQSTGAKSKAAKLRDLFDLGVRFEVALVSLGLSDKADDFRSRWVRWEAQSDGRA